jgi:hypothetical protein
MKGVASDDTADFVADFWHFCEHDPDRALLSFADDWESADPPTIGFLRYARHLCYKRKAFLLLRSGTRHPLADLPYRGVDVVVKEMAALSTNEAVLFVDMALGELRQLYDVDPGYVERLGAPDDPVGTAALELFACIVEALEPGKFQEFMGWTRLDYWTKERVRVSTQVLQESANKLVECFYAPFTITPSPRSAYVHYVQEDRKGRTFVFCQFFRQSWEVLETFDKFKDANPIGTSYLFSDGETIVRPSILGLS